MPACQEKAAFRVHAEKVEKAPAGMPAVREPFARLMIVLVWRAV
jgi:hypothetical protein